jgi:hypothetical protein
MLKYLMRIKRCKPMIRTRDCSGLSGLPACADPRAGVPMEVLLEQGISASMGIFLKFSWTDNLTHHRTGGLQKAVPSRLDKPNIPMVQL